MKKFPTTLTAAGLALAAATLTACAAPQVHDAAPTPSATAAPTFRTGPDSSVSRYLTAQRDDMVRGRKLNAQASLPINADRALAEAAAADGAPFAISYRSWPKTCAWIRMPNGSLWDLTGGAGTLTRDTTAEAFLQNGRVGQPPACNGGTTTASRYDAAIEAAALKAGAPYRWTDGCKQYMHLPGERTRFWIPDLPPEAGSALSSEEDMYGCSGMALPGQTTAPKGN